MEPGAGTMRAVQNPAGKNRTSTIFLDSVKARGHIPEAWVHTRKVESLSLGEVRRNAGLAGNIAYFGKRSGPAPGSLGQALI